MKNLLLVMLVVILAPLTVSIFPEISIKIESQESEWVSLFNGQDLTGWYTYQRRPEPTSEVSSIPRDEEGNYLEPIGLNNDPLNVFTIVEEDGEPVIRISGETFGILVTEQEFENYHLRLKFKWGDEKFPPREDLLMDSGILYHSVGEEGAWGGVWMKSLECQVMEENTGDFIAVDTTMAMIPSVLDGENFVYNEDADRNTFDVQHAVCNHDEDHEYPLGEWNTVEIYTVEGNSLHVVNGRVNMRLFNTQALVNNKMQPLYRGKIQLQSEGAEIFYKDIELRQIDEIPDEV